MSLYGISDTQLEQLMYPNGRGQYHYGGTPVMTNQTSAFSDGVQPGGVSMIGSTPVKTGIAASDNPAAGIAAGQPAATGVPAGAAAGPAAGGAGAYASVAGAAIQQIAQVASDYVGNKAKADILRSQQAIPKIPESGGALAGFQAPGLKL